MASKVGKRLAAAAMVAVLAIGGMGAAYAQESSAEQDAAQDSAQYASMEEWKEAYPEVFAQFLQHNIQTNTGNGTEWGGFENKDWSHGSLAVDEYNVLMSRGGVAGCMSCKSTNFNVLYDEMGNEAFAGVPEIDYWGETNYWDCNICHTSPDDLTLSTNMVYYNEVIADTFKDQEIEVQLCGQCHNSNGYYPMVTNAPDHMAFDPYKYGTDAEAITKRMLEVAEEYDGYDNYPAVYDETIGCALVTPDTNMLESFTGSVHDSAGLTCVSCHGAHSNVSPLKNEETMEFCVTCHGAMGVEDAEGMVAFVEQAQSELADAQSALKNRLGTVYDMLAEATAAGVEGDDIDQARQDYVYANAYFYWVTGYYVDFGTYVAHNPTATAQVIEQANALLDDAEKLLG